MASSLYDNYTALNSTTAGRVDAVRELFLLSWRSRSLFPPTLIWLFGVFVETVKGTILTAILINGIIIVLRNKHSAKSCFLGFLSLILGVLMSIVATCIAFLIISVGGFIFCITIFTMLPTLIYPHIYKGITGGYDGEYERDEDVPVYNNDNPAIEEYMYGGE